MKVRLARIKTHLYENRNVYIALAVGVAVGIALCKAPVIKVSCIRIFSPGDNVTNIINSANVAVRRGQTGYATVCRETGTRTDSINQMAKLMGLDARQISLNTRELVDSVGGFTFFCEPN